MGDEPHGYCSYLISFLLYLFIKMYTFIHIIQLLRLKVEYGEPEYIELL
jgi:hypothetical protein